MKGVRVDDQLLAYAESNYDETLSDLDDRAQAYADQFHSQVIVPFCNRHNLRFWSGNGVWFFEAPNGKKTFEDPEKELIAWGMATGNTTLSAHPTRFGEHQWVLTCGDDEVPEFFHNLSEIHRLLNLDFMGGCLGFLIDDHKPSTFPDRDWEKRGEKL